MHDGYWRLIAESDMETLVLRQLQTWKDDICLEHPELKPSITEILCRTQKPVEKGWGPGPLFPFKQFNAKLVAAGNWVCYFAHRPASLLLRSYPAETDLTNPYQTAWQMIQTLFKLYNTDQAIDDRGRVKIRQIGQSLLWRPIQPVVLNRRDWIVVRLFHRFYIKGEMCPTCQREFPGHFLPLEKQLCLAAWGTGRRLCGSGYIITQTFKLETPNQPLAIL